jgi:pimeloyl-ACP methyl ester carboxylesterase
MLKFLVIALIALLVIILLFVALIFFLRRQYGRSTKITSENGIQENTFIKLGGMKQFVSIRGKNTANPVILILHGGPGSPISLVGYHWQTGLELDYTLVNWEQRGCGRTYFENLGKKSKSKTSSKLSIYS